MLRPITDLNNALADYADRGDSAQEALTRASVGWTGKNKAYSQTNNAVIAHIENRKPYKVSWVGSATITLKKDSSGGTQVATGDTSPLSFTADSDFDLYFGSSADVTNIMIYDARIKDSTFEPYHESVDVCKFDRAEQRVMGAKNLWAGNYKTNNLGDAVTTQTGSDYEIQTATTNANSGMYIKPDAMIASFGQYGNIILSFEYKSSIACDGAVGLGGGGGYDIRDTGILPTSWKTYEKMVDASTIEYLTFYNRSAEDAPIISVRKIMVRLASDPDDTFATYAMTNKELTERTRYEVKAIVSGEALYRFGNVITVHFNNVTAEALRGATIPAGLRPVGSYTYTVIAKNGLKWYVGGLAINSNGTQDVYYAPLDGSDRAQVPNTWTVAGSVSYILSD